MSVRNDGDDAVLKSFVELAETAAPAAKPHIRDAINLMLHVRILKIFSEFH